MVDLATFRTFPRASPGRQSESLVAEQDMLVEKGTLTDDALATRFTQELRARRRAARTDLRESELWAEPAIVEPPMAPIPEAVAPVPALTAPAEAAEPEPIQSLSPVTPVDAFEESRDEYLEPASPSVDHPAAPHEPTLLNEAATTPALSTARDVHEEAAPARPPLDNEPVMLDPAPARLQPHHEEALAELPPREEEQAEPFPEPLVLQEAPQPSIGEASFLEPTPPPPSPVPVHDGQEEPTPLPSAAMLDETPAFENPELTPALHEAFPTDDPWPMEAPTTIEDEEALPIAPPQPIEVEADTPIHVDSPEPVEPESAETPTLLDQAPAPILLDYYSRDSLTLDYRLLGLANPLVCTVTGKLGDAAPIELTIGRTGIYRPEGFRPAPWSGFAYDVSPDGRTGFVPGTRVLTARGEIAVENLIPGDSALALRGPALLPIVWIGRSIAVSPPVEIAANAFGPGRPGNTLRVGADQPIFMQSMPVLARDLVNGDTIRTIETEAAELFHIDVGLAEVLLVEGVPLSSGCR